MSCSSTHVYNAIPLSREAILGWNKQGRINGSMCRVIQYQKVCLHVVEIPRIGFPRSSILVVIDEIELGPSAHQPIGGIVHRCAGRFPPGAPRGSQGSRSLEPIPSENPDWHIDGITGVLGGTKVIRVPRGKFQIPEHRRGIFLGEDLDEIAPAIVVVIGNGGGRTHLGVMVRDTFLGHHHGIGPDGRGTIPARYC